MYGTPQDVIVITGVTPDDLGLDEQSNPEKALNDLLETWLTRISAAIDVRLQGRISPSNLYYNGVIDVATRTVAKLVAVSKEQRIGNVVKINDYATSIINSSDVTKDLDKELAPYKAIIVPKDDSGGLLFL